MNKDRNTQEFMEGYIAKISKYDSKMGESTNLTDPNSPIKFGGSNRNVFNVGSKRDVFKGSYDGSKRDVFKSLSPCPSPTIKKPKPKKLDKVTFFPDEEQEDTVVIEKGEEILLSGHNKFNKAHAQKKKLALNQVVTHPDAVNYHTIDTNLLDQYSYSLMGKVNTLRAMEIEDSVFQGVSVNRIGNAT